MAARLKKTKITWTRSDLGDGGVRVQVESDRLSEEKSFLSFKFTDEGLIIDHVDNDGNVIKTFSNMYDEIEDLLQ